MIGVGQRTMREPINAKSMRDILVSNGRGATAHLSRFLAFAGYGSRKWIVDSKWHFLRDINHCVRDVKSIYFNESEEQACNFI